MRQEPNSPSSHLNAKTHKHTHTEMQINTGGTCIFVNSFALYSVKHEGPAARGTEIRFCLASEWGVLISIQLAFSHAGAEVVWACRSGLHHANQCEGPYLALGGICQCPSLSVWLVNNQPHWLLIILPAVKAGGHTYHSSQFYSACDVISLHLVTMHKT